MNSEQPADSLRLEDLPLPAFRLDFQNCVTHWNAAAEWLLERVAADAVVRLAPAWLERELSKMTATAGTDLSFEKEIAGEGVSRWFNVLVSRLGDEAGVGTGKLVLLVDITSQKGLQKLLRDVRRDGEARIEERTAELAWANASLRRYIDECHRSAAALRTLSSAIEQTADHVIITDKDGVIEYVNPAFEKLTGFSCAEVKGKTPRLVKSNKHPAHFFENLWQTILAGEVFRANFINRKKNGELYYEEKTITPIKDERGRITHFVSVGRAMAGPESVA